MESVVAVVRREKQQRIAEDNAEELKLWQTAEAL
jgi:hypothetical protein